MYSIGNVIYGVPLTSEVSEAIGKAGMVVEDIFETLYDGGGEDGICGYLGVSLREFDACENFKLTKIVAFPTEDQVKEVKAKIESFPKEIKDILPPVDVWVVWSTS